MAPYMKSGSQAVLGSKSDSAKEEWNNAICSNKWKDGEIIILSEFRERQISHDITYMWNLKDDAMNLYKTETDW